jgi:hypothetical protein
MTMSRHPEMPGQQPETEQNGRQTAPSDGQHTAPARPSVPVRGFRALRPRNARTHSGPRRPAIAPRSAYALVSGVRLG